VLADEVAAKVEQTVFDALADTVSAHSGQLTVLSNEIATKVERTEFDAVENRLSHAESTITQQAEMLEFRVVAYDENGEVSGAKLRISNIDGEGRIYLDAETIVSGVLKILGEMAIEVGDGTIRFDATGLHAKKDSQPTFRIDLNGDAWFGGDVEARTFILPVRSS